MGQAKTPKRDDAERAAPEAEPESGVASLLSVDDARKIVTTEIADEHRAISLRKRLAWAVAASGVVVFAGLQLWNSESSPLLEWMSVIGGCFASCLSGVPFKEIEAHRRRLRFLGVLDATSKTLDDGARGRDRDPRTRVFLAQVGKMVESFGTAS